MTEGLQPSRPAVTDRRCVPTSRTLRGPRNEFRRNFIHEVHCSIQCSPLVLLLRVVLRRRWECSIGGTILTGENWSTGRKTLYSVGGRWMNGHGALVEWYWQGKTEVLGEKHYTAWVVGEWMGMEHWWNDTDSGKLKYWEQPHSRRLSVNHKPHTNRPRIKACRPRLEASN